MGYRIVAAMENGEVLPLDKTFNSKTQVELFVNEQVKKTGVKEVSVLREKNGIAVSVVHTYSKDGDWVTGMHKPGSLVRIELPLGVNLNWLDNMNIAVQKKTNFVWLTVRTDNKTVENEPRYLFVPDGAVGTVVEPIAGGYLVDFNGIGKVAVPASFVVAGAPIITLIADGLKSMFLAENAGKDVMVGLGDGRVVTVKSENIIRVIPSHKAMMTQMQSYVLTAGKGAYRFASHKDIKSMARLATALLSYTFWAHYGGESVTTPPLKSLVFKARKQT